MYVKSDSILTRAPCGSRLLQRLSFHFPWVPYHFAQTLEITATVGSFVLSSMTQWTWWSTTLSWCWLMLSFSFFFVFLLNLPGSILVILSPSSGLHYAQRSALMDRLQWIEVNRKDHRKGNWTGWTHNFFVLFALFAWPCRSQLPRQCKWTLDNIG